MVWFILGLWAGALIAVAVMCIMEISSRSGKR